MGFLLINPNCYEEIMWQIDTGSLFYNVVYSVFRKAFNYLKRNLTPKEKFGFISILQAYEKNKLSTDDIEKMIKSQKVDLIKIYKPLFEMLLKACDMTKKEIKNFDYTKFTDFDLNYEKHIKVIN